MIKINGFRDNERVFKLTKLKASTEILIYTYCSRHNKALKEKTQRYDYEKTILPPHEVMSLSKLVEAVPSTFRISLIAPASRIENKKIENQEMTD